VQVAIVRGKAQADRREDIKRQDANREADRAMKSRKLA
ncbi:SsrA-binding protein, partial [Patescibacteria group bacterium]|nr:SsrA-binding protein [Patescibacteria group bacterium]MBU1755103.1 SsrA-binding protein [Patescibacteria group bacterium]